MVTDRELNAMMADGLLNTVRDAAKSLYGENQTYPCDDVKRMAAEVERLRAVLEHLRAELNEHGGRYWEARYRDEASDNERLRAALEACERAVIVHHAENEARAEWSGSNLAQRKAKAISARSGVLLHDIRTITRAALEEK